MRLKPLGGRIRPAISPRARPPRSAGSRSARQVCPEFSKIGTNELSRAAVLCAVGVLSDSRTASKHPTDTCLKSRSIYQMPCLSNLFQSREPLAKLCAGWRGRLVEKQHMQEMF